MKGNWTEGFYKQNNLEIFIFYSFIITILLYIVVKKINRKIKERSL